MKAFSPLDIIQPISKLFLVINFQRFPPRKRHYGRITFHSIDIPDKCTRKNYKKDKHEMNISFYVGSTFVEYSPAAMQWKMSLSLNIICTAYEKSDTK